MKLTVFSWLNLRSRSAILSDIYSLVQCVPLAVTVVRVILSPFHRGFKVTPKGISRNRFYFNWILALPLIILLIATVVSFWMNLGIVNTPQESDINLGLIWSTYNLLTISIALLTLLDVPKPDLYEWFPWRRSVRLTNADQTCWGVTARLSEVGAEIELRQNVSLNESVTLELIEEGLKLQGKITHTHFTGKFLKVRVKFEKVSLPQHRRLIEMLFCRPGQWKRRQTPGELRSLWLLFRVLLRPLVLLSKEKVRAIAFIS